MPDPLTRDGLARFDDVAAAHVADDDVPGVVALVACGDQVHVAASGSLSLGGAPVQRDSVFRIASTTKPVTGSRTGACSPGWTARSTTPSPRRARSRTAQRKVTGKGEAR